MEMIAGAEFPRGKSLHCWEVKTAVNDAAAAETQNKWKREEQDSRMCETGQRARKMI